MIEKSDAGDWSVTYKTSNPVNRIVLNRNPDGSRVERWKPVSSDYRIERINDIETISRLDGRRFSEVEFQLTPTYTPLPKEYAPFSPFSDGGMLFHSGRFFACPEDCDPDVNQWHMAASAPKDDNIIVGGRLFKNKASWIGIDSGSNIYVGNASPLADDNFVSLIDAYLPKELQEQMFRDLPELLEYFAGMLGGLDYRPALFASYSTTDDGTYGNQGGTLPGQIFMHWYGSKAMQNLHSDKVFWFFAHEVAHLYQKDGGQIEIREDAWVHEGAAEFFAGTASADMSGKKTIFQDKLTSAGENCMAELQENSNYAQVSSRNFRLHYNCGLLLINAINVDARHNDKSISMFDLWGMFTRQVESGQSASAQTFIETVKPYLSPGLSGDISQFSENPEFDSLAFFSSLLATDRL